MTDLSPGNQIGTNKKNLLGNETYGEEHDDTGVYEDVIGDIYAVGDIHGDSGVLIHVLCDLIGAVRHTGTRSPDSLIDDRLNWIEGNNSTIVFCGDLIDRLRPPMTPSSDDENSDLEIIRTLDRLDKQARIWGGRIFMVLGNHELSYGFNISKIPDKRLEYVSHLGKYQDRLLDFTPGSDWAKYVADNTYMALKIGNVVFTHAGICGVSEYLKTFPEPIETLNILIRKFLKTSPDRFEPNKLKLNSNVFNPDEIKEIIGQLDDTGSKSKQKKSFVLCRELGINDVICSDVDKVFRDLKMENPTNSIMLIAHSPQLPGMTKAAVINSGINSVCDNRLWRIDCGMTRGFDASLEQISEILVINLHTLDLIQTYGVLWVEGNAITDIPSKQMAVLKIEKGEDGSYHTNTDKIINHGYHPSTRPEYPDGNVAFSNLDRLLEQIIDKIPDSTSKEEKIKVWNTVFDTLRVNYNDNKYGTIIPPDRIAKDNEKIELEAQIAVLPDTIFDIIKNCNGSIGVKDSSIGGALTKITRRDKIVSRKYKINYKL